MPALIAAEIHLRDLVDADFPILFQLQHDAASARMAAFGTRDSDPDELAARWKRSRTDGTTLQKAIVSGEGVVGFVASFLLEGRLQVTYWVARPYWGRGVATSALFQLLQLVPQRPIYASAATDNVGSLRVLQKCGFAVCGSAKAFASARGEEIEEIFLELG
ncbi:MAG: GNAT family N-acetyltransferase [Polyangiaceae bacterium]